MTSYEAYLGVGIDASGAQAGANQFAGATDKVSAAAQKAAQANAKLRQQVEQAALMLKVFAVAAAGLAVREITTYTQALSNAQAMTNATADEMAKLSVVTRELGASTVFSAGQVADAAAELGKAGFNVNNIIEALPATLDLAAAASIGMAEASKITANIMAGFGLEAKDVAEAADVLAAISTASTTDVSGLGEAMKYAGPISRNLGISLQETAAAMSVLAQNGLAGGQAGRNYRSVLISLLSPSKEAQKAILDMGLKVKEVNPQFDSFQNIMRKFADAGLDATRAAEIFGAEGVNAVLALTGSIPAFEKMIVVANEATGTSKRIAEIKLDNIAGDWEKLTGELSETAMVLGSAGVVGALRDLIQTGTQWAEWLNKMVEGATKNKEQSALLNDVLIAVGATVAGIITLKAALWFYGLADAVVAATTAVTAFNAAVVLIGGAVLGALGYLFKMRMEIIELEKYTRKQEDALLDMAGATGEAARRSAIASLQMRRAQMRSTDEIIGDIARIQDEIAGIGSGYLLQNQAMLAQKRIKEDQLAQLQKELAMVEDLKKKEDELVVKKITTSRAYQQNVDLARQIGLAAMGMMTGNVTQAPAIPRAPLVAPIASTGGSAAATPEIEKQEKAFWGVSEAVASTSQEFEKYNLKNIELVSNLYESYEQELLRNSLIKEYGGDLSKVNLEMAILNEQKKLDIYATQQQQDEVRQLVTLTKEQQNANKQLTESAQKSVESQKQWNNQLTYAFKDAIMNSKNLGDALNNLANRVQDMLVNKALDSLLGGMFASMKFAKGAAFSAGGVTAFASGGVVNSPTMFPMRGGVGLMGEAGAEAIMPLTRTSNGDLGVKAVGSGTVINTSININVTGGTKEQNEDAGKRVSAAVRQAIDDTVVAVIMREKRPGGVLNAA